MGNQILTNNIVCWRLITSSILVTPLLKMAWINLIEKMSSFHDWRFVIWLRCCNHMNLIAFLHSVATVRLIPFFVLQLLRFKFVFIGRQWMLISTHLQFHWLFNKPSPLYVYMFSFCLYISYRYNTYTHFWWIDFSW